ncbi:MAG: hypothetical protein JWR80_1966 [Bradyrhizobium sp.]|nr:hypothetical protein [Bradyrhizobium sp.]
MLRDAHTKITGAPRNFTQITLTEVADACFWLHGTPLECDRIYVHGFIAGETGQSRASPLRKAVGEVVAAAAEFEQENVFVTITEIPAEEMRAAS